MHEVSVWAPRNVNECEVMDIMEWQLAADGPTRGGCFGHFIINKCHLCRHQRLRKIARQLMDGGDC